MIRTLELDEVNAAFNVDLKFTDRFYNIIRNQIIPRENI